MSASITFTSILAQAVPSLGEVASGALDAFGLLLALHLVQVLVLLGLVRLADVHEREPVSVILGMFLWGGTVAVLFSLVFNTWASGQLPPDVAAVFGAAIYAPVFEELSKGAALLAAFGLSIWAGRRFGTFEFGGVTDGIVYGIAVGFGFAFFENAQYFANFAATDGVAEGTRVFLERTDFLGVTGSLFGHGSYSAVAGAGLGLALWSRGWGRKLGFGLGGLAIAMLLHASWNGLISVALVREYGMAGATAIFAGGTIPAALAQQIELTVDTTITRAATVRDAIQYLSLGGIVVAVALWLRHEGRIIRYELADEVNAGVLPREEWELLSTVRGRTRAYWNLARRGQLATARAVKRCHDALVDLAMHKWRLRTMGGDASTLPTRRAQIQVLRDHAVRMAQVDPPDRTTTAGTGLVTGSATP